MIKKKLVKICGITACIVAAAVLIILPPSRGRLPESQSPNGLSERVELEVDGGSLGLFIISQDINNPVLIVCGEVPESRNICLNTFINLQYLTYSQYVTGIIGEQGVPMIRASIRPI